MRGLNKRGLAAEGRMTGQHGTSGLSAQASRCREVRGRGQISVGARFSGAARVAWAGMQSEARPLHAPGTGPGLLRDTSGCAFAPP